MSINITVPTKWYMLPDDGDECKSDFLGLLHSPGFTLIRAYNFSLPELFDEIRKANANGIGGDCLLDRIQAAGPSEKKTLAQLALDASLWNFTLSTAGETSKTPSAIEHDKDMLVYPTDGGDPHIFTGSVNFSSTGFNQGNEACMFRSKEFGSEYVKKFYEHQAWAREHLASAQIKSLIERGSEFTNPSWLVKC